VIASIEKLQLPDQIMLDGEWLARRTIDEIPESLFVFDVLWLNGEWQGNVPCWTRHQELLKLTGSRIMPECVESGFRAFFESRTKIPWTEGIVLKHKSSKVKGDPDECIKNALWVKLKWRSGDTGREVVDFNRV
jgi:ATP-dependent DNA ligase